MTVKNELRLCRSCGSASHSIFRRCAPPSFKGRLASVRASRDFVCAFGAPHHPALRATFFPKKAYAFYVSRPFPLSSFPFPLSHFR
jgi:hypothetical protein